MPCATSLAPKKVEPATRFPVVRSKIARSQSPERAVRRAVTHPADGAVADAPGDARPAQHAADAVARGGGVGPHGGREQPCRPRRASRRTRESRQRDGGQPHPAPQRFTLNVTEARRISRGPVSARPVALSVRRADFALRSLRAALRVTLQRHELRAAPAQADPLRGDGRLAPSQAHQRHARAGAAHAHPQALAQQRAQRRRPPGAQANLQLAAAGGRQQGRLPLGSADVAQRDALPAFDAQVALAQRRAARAAAREQPRLGRRRRCRSCAPRRTSRSCRSRAPRPRSCAPRARTCPGGRPVTASFSSSPRNPLLPEETCLPAESNR